MQNETFQLPSVFFKVLQRMESTRDWLVEQAEIKRHTKYNIELQVFENQYLKIIVEEFFKRVMQ